MEDIIIKLKKKEVLFVASIIGSDEFIGIEDSMFSLTKDDIKKHWIEVQNSLEEQQFIEVGFDGSIIIDELLNTIINTCTNCKIYLCQKERNRDKKTTEIHFYISEYLAIKMEEDLVDKDSVNFNLLLTVESVKEEIYKNLLLEELPVYSVKNVTLSEEVLEHVKDLLNKEDYKGALQILVDLGFENRISNEILGLMSDVSIYNSMIMMSFADGHAGKVDELIYLQSNNHLWRCKLKIIDDVTFYEFIPQSYREAKENIYPFIKQIKSIYIDGKEELVG